MTKVTQLEDRGAAVAWSPIASHADYLALGAKVCICVVYQALDELWIRCWPMDTARVPHGHAVSLHSLGEMFFLEECCNSLLSLTYSTCSVTKGFWARL